MTKNETSALWLVHMVVKGMLTVIGVAAVIIISG